MRQAKIVKVIFFLVFFTLTGGSCEGAGLCLTNCDTLRVVSPTSGTVFRQDEAPRFPLRIEVISLPQNARKPNVVEVWADGGFVLDCPIDEGYLANCEIEFLTPGTHQIEARMPLTDGREILDAVEVTWREPSLVDQVEGVLTAVVGGEKTNLDWLYLGVFSLVMLILARSGLRLGGLGGAWLLVVFGTLAFLAFLAVTPSGTVAFLIVGGVLVVLILAALFSRFSFFRYHPEEGILAAGFDPNVPYAAVKMVGSQTRAALPTSRGYRPLSEGAPGAGDTLPPPEEWTLLENKRKGDQ